MEDICTKLLRSGCAGGARSIDLLGGPRDSWLEFTGLAAGAARLAPTPVMGEIMRIESNKQIVREAYAAISRGDVDGFMNRLADDVAWYFIGTHRFAGTLQGKHAIMKQLFEPLGDALTATIALDLKQLIAEGDKVVAEMQGRSRRKDGKDYNNTYCIILTVHDGKIREMREYLDTELVTQVFGRG